MSRLCRASRSIGAGLHFTTLLLSPLADCGEMAYHAFGECTATLAYGRARSASLVRRSATCFTRRLVRGVALVSGRATLLVGGVEAGLVSC